MRSAWLIKPVLVRPVTGMSVVQPRTKLFSRYMLSFAVIMTMCELHTEHKCVQKRHDACS